MTMTNHSRTAIEQLAARFVFDDKPPAEQQRDLAQHIEAALAEFKTTQMQELIARTLRRALTERILHAIESWERGHDFPQPIAQEREDEPPAKRRPSKKAAAQERAGNTQGGYSVGDAA